MRHSRDLRNRLTGFPGDIQGYFMCVSHKGFKASQNLSSEDFVIIFLGSEEGFKVIFKAFQRDSVRN